MMAIGCPSLVGFTLVSFGVMFLLETLGVADNVVGRFWPLILIVLGLSSLFNVSRWRVRMNRFGRRWPPDIDR